MDDMNDFVWKAEDVYMLVAFGICWSVRSILVKLNRQPIDQTESVPPVFFRAIYKIGFCFFGIALVVSLTSEWHAIRDIHVTPWVSAFLKVGLLAGTIDWFQSQSFQEGYRQAWVHARQRLLKSADPE